MWRPWCSCAWLQNWWELPGRGDGPLYMWRRIPLRRTCYPAVLRKWDLEQRLTKMWEKCLCILCIELSMNGYFTSRVFFFCLGDRLCNEPTPPENGNMEGNEFWEGKSVTYKCNEGYELQGPTARVCNEMGEWAGEEPSCKLKYGESHFNHLQSREKTHNLWK